MLVLSRHKSEEIVIDLGCDKTVSVMVVEIRGDKVRLGISAPAEIPVHRREVYEAIRETIRMSMTAPTVQELGIIATAVERPQWEAVERPIVKPEVEYRIKLTPECFASFRVSKTNDGKPMSSLYVDSTCAGAHFFGEDAWDQRRRLLREVRDKLAGIVAAIDDQLGEQVPC